METTGPADSLPGDELERARDALAKALAWWNMALASESSGGAKPTNMDTAMRQSLVELALKAKGKAR